MPVAPMTPCPVPRCPTLTTGGRCATHAVQQEHQRDNFEVRRWYRTARWRTLRADVLREEPICRQCRQEITTDVDHIEKHHGTEALFFNRANLQGLGKGCHGRKTRQGQ